MMGELSFVLRNASMLYNNTCIFLQMSVSIWSRALLSYVFFTSRGQQYFGNITKRMMTNQIPMSMKSSERAPAQACHPIPMGGAPSST